MKRKTVFPRHLATPSQSFFLLGPRGTGKTMWLRRALPHAHYVNLLREDLYQAYLARPGPFALEMNAVPVGHWVVVDEIQRLPNLLNEVHRLMEERDLRFCLCGSSARKLKRAGVNLLGGRAVHRVMHPFLPEEVGEAFSLEAALRFGMLPVIWPAEDKDDALAAYARFYLKEEIQAEALVRNLPGFARFLPIAALCHGQVVNLSNLAREAGVARTTVAGFVEILEETLLGFRLPAFEARLRVRERRHPKWYWCDPGLVRAMKGASGPLVPEERGALFEGLVAQTLRAYRDYRRAFDEMHYWAAPGPSGPEVDFLIRRGDEFVAIEAKAGRTLQPHWGKGLRALKSLPGLRRRILVYPEGPPIRTDDGIEGFPFADLPVALGFE